MRPSRRALLAGAAGAGLIALPAEARPMGPKTPTDINVRTFSINAFAPGEPRRSKFGAFTFRGGLELQCDHKTFGGWSSLRLDPAGRRLTAISDTGFWLTANLTLADGRVTGLTDAKIAPVLGANGRPLHESNDWDCEALWIENGVAWIAVERTHKIFRFDTFGKDGVLARGVPTPVPTGGRKLRFNKGIEAIGLAPRNTPMAGTLIAIAEESLNDNGDMRAFLIGQRNAEFAVKRTNDFDVTDLTFLPDGDMLILERWFSPWRGVAMRIRRIDINTVKPDATVDGPIILSADMGYQIDNMEGIAIHREDSGATIITLISDDNFSFFQRTLLLQFSYDGK